MRRIILFSTPYNNPNFDQILNLIFTPDIKEKRALFMPSQGLANTKPDFLYDWIQYARNYKVDLNFIDNTAIEIKTELEKLMNSNILIISGGDPFQLLTNLRMSGFDEKIKQYTEKSEYILAGYSAGAYILTPSLNMAKIFNENYPGGKKYRTQDMLDDFKGLNIVKFEIVAHYSEDKHEEIFRNHIKNHPGEIKLIADDEYIVIDG